MQIVLIFYFWANIIFICNIYSIVIFVNYQFFQYCFSASYAGKGWPFSEIHGGHKIFTYAFRSILISWRFSSIIRWHLMCCIIIHAYVGANVTFIDFSEMVTLPASNQAYSAHYTSWFYFMIMQNNFWLLTWIVTSHLPDICDVTVIVIVLIFICCRGLLPYFCHFCSQHSIGFF